MRSYCLRHGLLDSSFRYWRRAIADRDRQANRSTRPWNAGLIAVEIVGETSPSPMVMPTMEIECPGGPVVRVREDVSVEILQRVMRTCQQILRGEVEDLIPAAGVPLRRPSC